MPRKPEVVYGWNPRYGKRAVVRGNTRGKWMTQSLLGELWGMNPVRYFYDRDVKYRRSKK